MSNIQNNRINVTITTAEMATAKQHFLDLRTQLPFLVGLATGEKGTMTGIQVDNKQWVEDCINEMEQDSSFLPSFLSVKNVQNDLDLFKQIEVLKVETKDFLDRLSDTQFLAGAEAYAVCLIYYKVLEAAARAGVTGADERYKRLKGRFEGQGPQGGSTPPAPRPTDGNGTGSNDGSGAGDAGTAPVTPPTT